MIDVAFYFSLGLGMFLGWHVRRIWVYLECKWNKLNRK